MKKKHHIILAKWGTDVITLIPAKKLSCYIRKDKRGPFGHKFSRNGLKPKKDDNEFSRFRHKTNKDYKREFESSEVLK
ncbi:hypothetical protein HZS_126 [Henneguya salminicola]|nr:hypothetical protein HZS_126 [Henneguya salminicola]